ncbi:hypothetical protein [Streptomyces sp. ISL-11]|uniref:hypothetical protein n=1 Tax=Streptomyces sp. ISL-11 TaxID=2819174 RepID=UPI001BEC84F3|nr:hypothetical protein [Streptomyces sp. ISL-11]MBT2382082.1 hypothetical protein [Streptomyces sp. ISL-11]
MTPQQRRRALWITSAVIGVTLVGLGAYFIHIGLNRSSSISGVLGFFVSAAGLAISIFSLIQTRPNQQGTSPRSVRMSQQSGANSINLQSGGDMNLGDSNQLGGS